MNLNFIFLLFVNYCKNLSSPYVSKILISLIISKIVLIIIEPKKNQNKLNLNINPSEKLKTQIKFYKKESYKNLLSKDAYIILKKLSYIDGYEKHFRQDHEKPLDITCSLKHLENSTHLKKDSIPIKLEFNMSKFKNPDILPLNPSILLSTLNILDTFKGKISFSKNITSIKEIKNKLILTSNKLVIDKENKKCGTLFLEGYLESNLTLYSPKSLNLNLISKKENYIIKTPFNDEILLIFDHEIDTSNNYFNSFIISLKESLFTVDFNLLDKYPIDEALFLYNTLNLSIIVSYTLKLYALK